MVAFLLAESINNGSERNVRDIYLFIWMTYEGDTAGDA